jgi:YidC/Oxa1 family membrane protein insertase
MDFKWNDNTRLIAAVVLSGLVLLIYTTFFAPQPEPPQATNTEPAQSQPTQSTQGQNQQIQATAPGSPSGSASTAAQPAANDTKQRPGRIIKVSTQVADLFFHETGGALQKVVLSNYYNKPGKQGGNFEMLDLTPVGKKSLELNLGNLDQGLSKRLFEANQDNLVVKEGSNNKLVFVSQANNLTVKKTYLFRPDAYDFDLSIEVTNQRGQSVMFAPEIQLLDTPRTNNGNMYAFVGVNALKDGALEELDLDDLEDKPVLTGDIKWSTLCIPYFMGAVIPMDGQGAVKRSLAARQWQEQLGEGRTQAYYSATLVDQARQLDNGQTAKINYLIFFGPRDLAILEPIGHELDRSVDFGWLDIIAKPMLSLLNMIYGFAGNYGIAIILVTILTKIVFWPVSARSYKSMKRMQALQPQMQKIREKYKDDKQRQQQEQMALFKTHKVNPLGGCLPMLVQIPFFISFYQILGGSIELMHAPFLGWINDLSAPDRLFIGFDIPYVGGLPVLTLLMGASMFLQQKMTPTTGDPTQAKMMMMLPVVFTFIFINMPSGLVLYWFINNLLSIGQQYYTNKSKAK